MRFKIDLKIFILLFLIFLISSCVQENKTLIINSKNSFFKIETIHYLSTDQNFSKNELDTFRDFKMLFQKNGEYHSFGITKNTIYLYFELEKTDNSKWILEIPYPPLESIQIFQKNKLTNEESYHKSGIDTPSRERYSEHPFYQFPVIDSVGNIEFIIALNCSDPINLGIFFWNIEALNKYDGYRHLAFGFFFGIVLALILYNFFLFLTIRDKTYLYYILYILSYKIFLLYVYGYMGYIYRDLVVNFHNGIMPLFATLPSIFALLFTRRFLNIQYFSPFLNKLIYLLIIFGFIIILLLSFVSPFYKALLGNMYPFLGVIVILAASWIALNNKYKPAIYFIIAWFGLLIGVLFFILSNFDVIPSNFYTRNIQIPGVAFEAVLLSLALGYRINLLRETEELTRKDALNKEIQSREYTEKLNKSFKRFVPAEFLKNLNKSSILEIHKGDFIQCKMAVMFTDIRGFTSLSEKIEAEEIFHFLNSYLESMEPIIHKYNGFIDKFIGDAIMALFPDQVSSIKASIEMLELSSSFKVFSNESVDIGIGIHYGELILGTIGSMSRLDTTVIGDTVNLANRIEGLNKVYGTKILVSEEVIKSINSESFIIREIDRVKVKGKNKSIFVYEILV
jgi:class 3 adenylate cyclase